MSESPFQYASPVQHCGEEEAHGSHEWLLHLRRTQCPGTPVSKADIAEQGRIWAYRCPALSQYLVQLGSAWIEEMVAEGADPADAEEHVRDCLPPSIWAAAKEAATRGD